MWIKQPHFIFSKKEVLWKKKHFFSPKSDFGSFSPQKILHKSCTGYFQVVKICHKKRTVKPYGWMYGHEIYHIVENTHTRKWTLWTEKGDNIDEIDWMDETQWCEWQLWRWWNFKTWIELNKFMVENNVFHKWLNSNAHGQWHLCDWFHPWISSNNLNHGFHQMVSSFHPWVSSNGFILSSMGFIKWFHPFIHEFHQIISSMGFINAIEVSFVW